MAKAIVECRENFGQPPRKFSIWDRYMYLRVSKPNWLHQDSSDGMWTLFNNMRALFEHGAIVWGQIVQANSQLFEHGRFDCPAEVVFSLSDAHKVTPEFLDEVSHKIFALKDTKPANKFLIPFANHLSLETTRVYGLEVPRTISSKIRCMCSSTFIVRKHLPNRKLCAGLLPLVVNPRPPHITMPLPARYWPEALVNWWIRQD